MAPLETPRRIFYRAGYRYQLAAHYAVQLSLRGHSAVDDFVTLEPGGKLTIQKGYAWDGPSGPALDTRTFLRASLVHDALYQLIRRRLLPQDAKADADAILHAMCLEDGMWRLRAAWVRWAVSAFAAPATQVERTVWSAP